MSLETIATAAVHFGYRAHNELGPGLLESVYEAVISRSLEKSGYSVKRQHPVSFEFDGMTFHDAFRIDILVEKTLVIEIKSVERDAPVHGKQLLTYLRLTKLPLGLLMNFGQAKFKDGVRRIVNSYAPQPQSP